MTPEREAAGPPVQAYLLAADVVRAQVEDGTLKPGQPAPSSIELRKATGYSQMTCLKGLRFLAEAGVLTRGPGLTGRFRVPNPGTSPAEVALAVKVEALSQGLAVRRHASGMDQVELAQSTGFSVTAVMHAETGRLWQSRRFWERADTALHARGELLMLHDAYLRARDAAAQGQPAEPRRVTLTARQLEIAGLFVQGLSVPAIARELGCSRGTASNCVARVQAKTGTGGGPGARVRLAAWLQNRDAGSAVPS